MGERGGSSGRGRGGSDRDERSSERRPPRDGERRFRGGSDRRSGLNTDDSGSSREQMRDRIQNRIGSSNGSSSGQESFRLMDKNGNSFIERSEFRGPSVYFDRLDLNKDGKVSYQEVKQKAASGQQDRSNSQQGSVRGVRLTPQKQAEFFVRKFDKDGDGSISLENEVPQSGLFRMRELDSNDDGMITPDEYRKVASQNRREMSRQPGDSDNGFNRRPSRHIPPSEDFQNWFTETDGDQDKRVSPDEFRKSFAKYFEMIDGNKDGFLDSNELNMQSGPPPRPDEGDGWRPARDA